MNTDRITLPVLGAVLGAGVRAMAWSFTRSAMDAEAQSRRTLTRILALNGGTEFGRRHGLDGRLAESAFDRLPLTTYEDYRPYVERIAAGEQGLLTADAIDYFLVTSGTTGTPKLVPTTARQSRLMRRHMLAPLGLALRERVMAPMTGRWMFLITTPPTVPTPGGVARGTVSNAVVSQMKRVFDRVLSSPPLVLQTTGQSVSRYLHFLFALRDERLWSIVGLYPSFLLNGFRELVSHAPEFLRDLADGTLSERVAVTEERRGALRRLLGRHPARARALTLVLERGPFTARAIWPRLTAVLTANSGAWRFYTEQLRPYLGGVPILSPAYAASEGIVGVGLPREQPGYAVSPRGAYVEFLPAEEVERPGARPRNLREVEIGRVYEVVLTTYTGLCRYRLGDLVKVLGWYGRTPVVDFVERRGQLLDVAGEKVTEAQVVQAFEAACREISVPLVDFVVTIDGDSLPARYLLLLERASGAGPARDEDLVRLLAAFDAELRARTLYDFARKTGALLPMAALVLERDSFERFNQHRLRLGASAQQLKTPHVVSDPTFATRYFSRHHRLALPDDHLRPVALY
jgi:auxin responsive GH3 gene family